MFNAYEITTEYIIIINFICEKLLMAKEQIRSLNVIIVSIYGLI
jgi:hypothetical protein